MSDLPQLPEANESDRPTPLGRYMTQQLTRLVPIDRLRAMPRRRKRWWIGGGVALALTLIIAVTAGSSSQASAPSSFMSINQSGSGASGAGWVDEQLEAWDDADLEPGGFAEVDPSSLGAAECRGGAASAHEVTLCSFSTARQAAAAVSRAESSIKSSTGIVVARDNRLLVIVDRRNADPSGKTINKLAKSFR